MVKNDRKMKHALKWEKLFKFRNEQDYVAKHIKKQKSSDNGKDLQEIKVGHELWETLCKI